MRDMTDMTANLGKISKDSEDLAGGDFCIKKQKQGALNIASISGGGQLRKPLAQLKVPTPSTTCTSSTHVGAMVHTPAVIRFEGQSAAKVIPHSYFLDPHQHLFSAVFVQLHICKLTLFLGLDFPSPVLEIRP